MHGTGGRLRINSWGKCLGYLGSGVGFVEAVEKRSLVVRGDVYIIHEIAHLFLERLQLVAIQ